MINILFIFLCLVDSISGHRFDGIVKDDLEIEKELKLINKSPLKSIHTKFGYIVDCIDINKQPAFDHPLLMNHKLQRKPSSQNEVKKVNVKSSSTKATFGLAKDQCPIGTVPIRRTTKEDLIRGKSFFNNFIFDNSPHSHVAHVSLGSVNPLSFYHGISGTNSVYNVNVQKDQSSSSIMWVRNGAMDQTNLIGFGWHVAPELYNDDATHLYAMWTSDNFKSTGCFNILCSGFVQTSKEMYFGGRFDNTSIYGGMMIEITISIIQDPKTNNWWLSSENENLGYFPISLFSNMTYADQVGWGGITTSLSASSPPMGSGYFPDDIFNHVCYFRDVTYQNSTRINSPPKEMLAQTFTDKSECFNVKFYHDTEGGEVGDAGLQFGGPGGNCGD